MVGYYNIKLCISRICHYSLIDSHSGIGSSFQVCINSTMDSLSKSLSISWQASITVKLKEGGDGSGNHALYHQLSNLNTHNIFMDMFCVLRNSDTRTGVPLYICNAPGPDSPHNQQPLFILMGKESAEIMGEDIKRVDRKGTSYSLSRKTCQEDCTKDTLVRLWLKSDPLIRSY